ncbi:hypothetical protein TcasGA2_TC005549 [Tribolium castaneum]|uniref:Uncharacterized protein n=1 Tax=Tribolium castaneum TaxID=7070 RepID=D6WXK6_TRICA|nr:hypothetical protein TcasGA2_TC005549 [Tribolium castaneum]
MFFLTFSISILLVQKCALSATTYDTRTSSPYAPYSSSLPLYNTTTRSYYTGTFGPISSYSPYSTSWRYRRTTTSYHYYTSTQTPQQRSSTFCSNHRDTSKEFPQHGDLICYAMGGESGGMYKNGRFIKETLLLRDSITHEIEEYSRKKYYSKKLEAETFVTKVNILNYGEADGFVQQVVIKNGQPAFPSVSAMIEIPPNKEVKLFVEVYGVK